MKRIIKIEIKGENKKVIEWAIDCIKEDIATHNKLRAKEPGNPSIKLRTK